MATLFSIGFVGLFVTFGIAAIVGHALLAEALLRPFFGKLDLSPQPRLTSALPMGR